MGFEETAEDGEDVTAVCEEETAGGEETTEAAEEVLEELTFEKTLEEVAAENTLEEVTAETLELTEAASLGITEVTTEGAEDCGSEVGTASEAGSYTDVCGDGTDRICETADETPALPQPHSSRQQTVNAVSLNTVFRNIQHPSRFFTPTASPHPKQVPLRRFREFALRRSQ